MVKFYAMLSKRSVHHYGGVNLELGTECGRLFRVDTLAVFDAGDSDIIRFEPNAAGTSATGKKKEAPAAADKDYARTVHLNLALIAYVSL